MYILSTGTYLSQCHYIKLERRSRNRHVLEFAPTLLYAMLISHTPSFAPYIPLTSLFKRSHLPTVPLFHTHPCVEFKLGGTAEFVTQATVMLMAGNNGSLGHVSISEGAS